ncbi:MAG: hypothetical protein ACMUEM_00425 [Flavobacteriales bacterium AspAUS03]
MDGLYQASLLSVSRSPRRQYIIIISEQELIIVRLDKKNDNTKRFKKALREEIYFFVEEVSKMLKE